MRVARVRVNGVKITEKGVKSKGNGTKFELALNSSYPSSNYRGSTVLQ